MPNVRVLGTWKHTEVETRMKPTSEPQAQLLVTPTTNQKKPSSATTTTRRQRPEGNLKHVAKMLFECAYGLNGCKRMDHAYLIAESARKYQCSERAVKALIYG